MMGVIQNGRLKATKGAGDNGSDDTHQGTRGTQEDGLRCTAWYRSYEGAHSGSTSCGDVRVAAGNSCPCGQEGQG